MTTWSPVDKHADITLSNGDLTVTRSAVGSPAWRSVRSTTSHSTGRYYLEFTLDEKTSSGNMMGFANSGASLSNYIGSDINSHAMQSDGSIWSNAVFAAHLTAPTVGHVIGCYIDLDANYIQFRNISVSGAWGAKNTLSANLTAAIEVFAAVSLYQTGNALTVNFGASGFYSSIPSYMQSWDLAQTGLYVPGWDPMHKNASVTLSGSNLIATSSGATNIYNVRAMEGLRNGPSASGIDKVYWEVVLTTNFATAAYAGLGKSTVGVGTPAGDNISVHADAWAMTPNNGAASGAWHISANTVPAAAAAMPQTVRIAWDRATGKVWMGLVSTGTWLGGGDPTAGTSPTFTLTGSEVYYPMATLRGSVQSATLVYSGFAGGLPADYVSIQDAVEDPDEPDPFPTPTPTPGGGGLPISEELAAYLGLPPKPAPPPVQLTNFDGTPTRAFHDYLTKQYEWERRLHVVLTEG